MENRLSFQSLQLNVLKFALLVLGTLSMLSCATTSQPLWVKQHPVDPEFYTGVGIVNKISAHGDHIARAREVALNEIASNIATSIVSESSLQIIQEAGVHRQTFVAGITSKTKSDLEGYELVDTWENQTEYRVYYRLSKSLHKELLERKLQQIAIRAGRFFSEGERAELSGDIVSALSFYFQAAKEIGDYWGYGLPKQGFEKDEYIDTEIYIRLKTILTSVNLNAQPKTMKARFLEPADQPFIVETFYLNSSGESAPLAGLPLKSETIKGRASVLNLETADNDGITNLFVKSAESIGFTEIQISVDLEVLGGLAEDHFRKPIFNSLRGPGVTVSLQVPPANVMFEINEINIGNAVSIPVTGATIGQALTEAGWVITNNRNEAEFVIRINASSIAGTERMGIYTAFAGGMLSMLRTTDNEEILTISNSQVSAGNRDYESAGRLALERLAERFINEINKGVL